MAPTPTGTQLMQTVEREYSQVNDLWERLESTGGQAGFDSDKVNQAKQQIVTARDALKNAHDILQGGDIKS